jgi:hypothetical protein
LSLPLWPGPTPRCAKPSAAPRHLVVRGRPIAVTGRLFAVGLPPRRRLPHCRGLSRSYSPELRLGVPQRPCRACPARKGRAGQGRGELRAQPGAGGSRHRMRTPTAGSRIRATRGGSRHRTRTRAVGSRTRATRGGSRQRKGTPAAGAAPAASGG